MKEERNFDGIYQSQLVQVESTHEDRRTMKHIGEETTDARLDAHNMTVFPLPVGLLTPILSTPLSRADMQACMTSTWYGLK